MSACCCRGVPGCGSMETGALTSLLTRCVCQGSRCMDAGSACTLASRWSTTTERSGPCCCQPQTCVYPPGAQLGHNFGLMHAFEGTCEYCDLSCTVSGLGRPPSAWTGQQEPRHAAPSLADQPSVTEGHVRSQTGAASGRQVPAHSDARLLCVTSCPVPGCGADGRIRRPGVLERAPQP